MGDRIYHPKKQPVSITTWTISSNKTETPNGNKIDLDDKPIRNFKEFEAFVFSQSEETQRALGKIIAFLLHCATKQ